MQPKADSPMGGIVCRCSRGKDRRSILCFVCAWSLPEELRQRLYEKSAEEREAAYTSACRWLDTHQKYDDNRERSRNPDLDESEGA
jgi:hypothetical protein